MDGYKLKKTYISIFIEISMNNANKLKCIVICDVFVLVILNTEKNCIRQTVDSYIASGTQ